ncbi:MAG: hypothetical protein V4484_10960 [Pseudomonadota bacterium]
MKTTTKLRLTGAIILLVMLWVIGTYNLTHPLVAVVVFGFAAGFEILVVRPAKTKIDGGTNMPTTSKPTSQLLQVQETPLAAAGKTDKFNERAESKQANDAPHDEDELWAVAIAEFEGDQRRAGLWAKCYATENGDEVKAKAAYLKNRVQQLTDDAATQKKAAAIQQALASQELLDGIAEATKGLIAGTSFTQKDVVFLARASHFDASLLSLTDRNRGDTLLHLCARYGFHEEAMILLKNGASPTAGNGNGQKPFAVAVPGSPLHDALLMAAEEAVSN